MDAVKKIMDVLAEDAPGVVMLVDESAQLPVFVVRREGIVQALTVLRDRCAFESLMCQTASDREDRITIIYHLFSTARRRKIMVKTDLPRVRPFIESAEEIWRAANWYEREIYDLFGVEFVGHSDLVRIMLPDDWEGHPLLKDYRPAAEYHGIKIETSQ